MCENIANTPDTERFRVYEVVQPTLPNPNAVVKVKLAPVESIHQKVIDPTQLNFCRPEVKAFAELMEMRLRDNDHKPGWKDADPFALSRRAIEHLFEIHDELGLMHPKTDCWDILTKCADVANYMMMVADTERSNYDTEGIRKLSRQIKG